MTGRGVGEQVVDHVDLLSALPGFDSLDLDTKRQLSGKFEKRAVEEGDVLINQGQPSPQ